MRRRGDGREEQSAVCREYREHIFGYMCRRREIGCKTAPAIVRMRMRDAAWNATGTRGRVWTTGTDRGERAGCDRALGLFGLFRCLCWILFDFIWSLLHVFFAWLAESGLGLGLTECEPHFVRGYIETDLRDFCETSFSPVSTKCF